MTILGWQLNTWSDAAFHFVLGYQIVNFRILAVPFNKVLFWGGELPKTFSAVSPEIRLPKTFSALYLWKFNLNEITGDHANENYEVNMWVLVVVFFHYVIFCCQYPEPRVNIKKQPGQRLGPFLCLNCFTNTLKYYRKNYENYEVN
jgi:fucose 4-O-acetylase-like acetyltransferase